MSINDSVQKVADAIVKVHSENGMSTDDALATLYSITKRTGVATRPHEVKVLCAHVKAHALAHYNDGGWDVIVECYDDEMLAEQIGRARTAKGALAKFEAAVDIWADREADARNSAF